MSLPRRGEEAGAAAEADRVAALAESLADARRVRILRLLGASPATVNEVAATLNLRPAQTSLQLARLRRTGLVRVVRRGRHRIYSGDPDRIRELLETLGSGGAAPAAPSELRLRRRLPPPPMRRARTCYDHLAGALAVELAERLVTRGWLVGGARDFLVTEKGERQLLRRGVDVVACREARRRLAPGCLDWSERRSHIGGALGAALLRSLESAGIVKVDTGRMVRTERTISDWLLPNDRGRSS